VLYGLRLTFQDIGQVGMAGVVIDALVLSSTLLAQWIGQKLLGMDKRTTMLVGAGASICGAAAVLATEPVVRAAQRTWPWPWPPWWCSAPSAPFYPALFTGMPSTAG
jgi:uncharacterized integral membrane protein (TIGR00698 family)